MVRHNILIFFGIICLLIVDNAIAVQLNQSVFDLEGQKIRYDVAASLNSDSSFNVEIKNDDSRVDSLKHRSPAKAFFMSLVVPGAGQFYNKSKLKSIGFFGVEVASWLLYSKWHSEADDMTDEFEKFNRDHWSEEDYDTLLSWTYGQTDDELVDAVEISHHLPDTRTQQYYEMTGKYDQFAWGW
ncbi:MAG: DUF5683 domain-containing protein, partial [candidate division Zixibacteria bacterium]|nr:DUF5683 domain-containing protein [candidate division Zixibacteria bacterium]